MVFLRYRSHILGKGTIEHCEFHRSCIPADADLLTVRNIFDKEGHISGGGLPFTLHIDDADDLNFMPRPEPINLGSPWGATFFGVLSGLPSWVLIKVVSSNDFVHTLKFHVPSKTIERYGCLSSTTKAHDITFLDLLFGIMCDKISRSLLRTPHAGIATPAQAMEFFISKQTNWHDVAEENAMDITRAGRALGAMMVAYSASPSQCAASCCGGVPGKANQLSELQDAISRISDLVGGPVTKAAKGFAKELKSGKQLMQSVVSYPAGERDKSSDVISCDERDAFRLLNERPAPVPVGEVIGAMPIYHPVMTVTAEAMGIINIVNTATTVTTTETVVADDANGSSSIGGGNGNGGGGGEVVPMWEPAVWVPPPGSATWVHPDKEDILPTSSASDIGAGKEEIKSGEKTGEEKTTANNEEPRKRRLSSRQLIAKESSNDGGEAATSTSSGTGEEKTTANNEEPRKRRLSSRQLIAKESSNDGGEAATSTSSDTGERKRRLSSRQLIQQGQNASSSATSNFSGESKD